MGPLPAWLNPFDILIGFALLGGAAWGFVRGLVRMALNLLVLYVAAVLAMTFYAEAGKWLGYMFGTSKAVSEAMAFLGILALVSITINFILRRTYKNTELPGLRQVDQLGGMIIGFFLASIWISFAILALAFVLGAAGSEGGGVTGNLIAYFQTSNLIPIFYQFLPVALVTLRPWMPKGLPPEIFTVRL
jgi:uncharacterized membrane protein required for colicin V production